VTARSGRFGYFENPVGRIRIFCENSDSGVAAEIPGVTGLGARHDRHVIELIASSLSQAPSPVIWVEGPSPVIWVEGFQTFRSEQLPSGSDDQGRVGAVPQVREAFLWDVYTHHPEFKLTTIQLSATTGRGST